MSHIQLNVALNGLKKYFRKKRVLCHTCFKPTVISKTVRPIGLD